MKLQRSLKARALQYLAQREHSRSELRRKLMPHALAEDASAQAEGRVSSEPAAARVGALLEWLEANNYSSQERFVESRVHARAARFGNLRIRSELKQHELVLPPEAAQALKDSEFERARQVFDRRFGGTTLTAVERAKHARFLSGRGFSPETVRRLLRGAGSREDDDAC